MFRRCLAFLFALLALTISAETRGTTTAPVPPSTPYTPRWDLLLAWLPEDTETLIVAPGPFEISTDKPESKEEKPDFASAFQFLPTGPLLNLKDGLLGKELAGLKVLCVVEGSRCFTPPGELGLMPYEGCHIIQFDTEADDTLKKVVLTCLKKADKKIEVGDVRIAVFIDRGQYSTWTYFVCRPSPGVLICATNREYLEETLKRIDRKPGTRALPADLPEWKHVDVKARVWGIRHYCKETAKEDPSSPLHGDDPAAIGLVFWIDADSKALAQVRYLSGAKDPVKIATKAWEVLGLKPKIKQGTPGVIEIPNAIGEEEAAGMFLFVLMLRLGHGILV